MTQAQQSAPDVRELPRTFSVEEQEAFLGKMAPEPGAGASAPAHYMTLDEFGTPTGLVSLDIPDGPYISVMATVPVDPDSVTTMSGAPLTTQMNPAHSNFDAGLEERNPTPPVFEMGPLSAKAKAPVTKAPEHKAPEKK